jgi:hypothetical protein
MSCNVIICSGGRWQFVNGVEEYVPLTKKCLRRGFSLPTNISYEELIKLLSDRCGFKNYIRLSYKMSTYTHSIDILDDNDILYFINVILNDPSQMFTLYVTEEAGVGSSSVIPEFKKTEPEYYEMEKTVSNKIPGNVVPVLTSPFKNESCPFFDETQPDPKNLADIFWSMPDSLPDPTNKIQKVVTFESTGLFEGQCFSSKNELKLELGKLCISRCFDYKVDRSSKTRFEASCVTDGCDWRIRAYLLEDTSYFQVSYFKDEHTCSRTQTFPHIRQANKKVLGEVVKNQIKDSGRSYRPKDIMTDIKQRFKINISYSQAWRAKSFALELLTGSPEDSFSKLPIYCHNLKKTNPGTVTHILTDSEGRFEMFFLAIGAAVSFSLT